MYSNLRSRSSRTQINKTFKRRIFHDRIPTWPEAFSYPPSFGTGGNLLGPTDAVTSGILAAGLVDCGFDTPADASYAGSPSSRWSTTLSALPLDGLAPAPSLAKSELIVNPALRIAPRSSRSAVSSSSSSGLDTERGEPAEGDIVEECAGSTVESRGGEGGGSVDGGAELGEGR